MLLDDFFMKMLVSSRKVTLVLARNGFLSGSWSLHLLVGSLPDAHRLDVWSFHGHLFWMNVLRWWVLVWDSLYDQDSFHLLPRAFIIFPSRWGNGYTFLQVLISFQQSSCLIVWMFDPFMDTSFGDLYFSEDLSFQWPFFCDDLRIGLYINSSIFLWDSSLRQVLVSML